jgi:hypothetical protein
MASAGMTGRTRAKTTLASQAARRNRWPAGTLAAAGTIPACTMNAYATLVFSQGHHPANHRSAIPARVYDSGSGHGHDAAPAGPPPPPRPPPEPRPPGLPGRPSSAPGSPRQGRLRRRPASAPRTLTRATARTTHGSYPGHGTRKARPRSPPSHTTQPSKPPQVRHRICKALTSRFIWVRTSAAVGDGFEGLA